MDPRIGPKRSKFVKRFFELNIKFWNPGLLCRRPHSAFVNKFDSQNMNLLIHFGYTTNLSSPKMEKYSGILPLAS